MNSSNRSRRSLPPLSELVRRPSTDPYPECARSYLLADPKTVTD